MTVGHLSTDRLLALYHGDTEDFAALEHLASCSECRRAFDDSRWFLLLRRLPALVAAGPHPDGDQLAAYHTHALPVTRTAEIERHLRSCEVCLARAGRSRVSERQTEYLSPAAASVRRAMKQFRPRPLRRLGALLVTGLDKRRIKLLFVPEPATERFAYLDAMPMVGESDMRELYACEALADAGAPQSRDEGSTKSEPVRISADGLDLVFVPELDDDRTRLAVQLLATVEGRSTAQVRIRIRDAAGGKTEAVTDDEGCAFLPFGPGRSEITIEVDPRLVLCVDVSG
jgi:hypothetical protein